MWLENINPFKRLLDTAPKQHGTNRTNIEPNAPKVVDVGIIGTGKIGTDLLIKIMRSPHLSCTLFSGRNAESQGIMKAKSLGAPTSIHGIQAFKEKNTCKIVFDATSAKSHHTNSEILTKNGIFVIDMTPSLLGTCIVPAVHQQNLSGITNVSMISCGGQASIPMAYTASMVFPEIVSICVESWVSPDSIGPGTLDNIDEYHKNTKTGLVHYTGVKNIDVKLYSDNSHLGQPMKTRITINTNNMLLDRFKKAAFDMEKRLKTYVPGYKIITIADTESRNKIIIDIEVTGRGDYLPMHAGNLDIINCAAISTAETYAKSITENSTLKLESYA